MAYREILYIPGDEPVFCYRSGLMVYEETFTHGALMASGWNSAGYPLNVLQNCPSRIRWNAFELPTAFRLQVDGMDLDTGWKFDSFCRYDTESGIGGDIRLTHTILPLALTVTTLLDGTAMLTRRLTLTSLDDGFHNVGSLSLMSGGMEQPDITGLTDGNGDPDKYYSVGYFDMDQWGHEGAFAWHKAVYGKQTVDCRFGRDRFRHPALFIRNNLLGHIFYMQTAWSGGCGFTVDLRKMNSDRDVTLAFQADLTGCAPLLALRPQESFTFPDFHIGLISGGLDEAVNDMHTHIRKSVLNLPEASGAACYVGAGMGAEHDMSMKTTLQYVDQFAKMGAEIFIIDAGWECPPAPSIDWGGFNGVNKPDPDRYPDNGLSRIRDHCHELGVKFALWVEIERLGDKCEAYRRHPEWRAYDRFGRQTPGFLDFTNPEAAAWAENELARIITEYGLELLRVDYNQGPWEYFALRDTTGTGHPECLALRSFHQVYRMYQNLKKRFPDVVFENCAGGGGRTDLGQMKAFNHTWVSDWQVPPRSVSITNGMTMVLPPERVDRLFAGMGCHRSGSLAFHMRNTMLSHMSLNVISSTDETANEDAMDFIAHSVRVYKDFIRPFLPECLTWHLTPEIPETIQNGFSALEVSSPDKTRAALAAFTLTDPKHSEFIVYPKGLSASKTYKVTFDNTGDSCRMTGAALIRSGLRLVIPGALQSELVLFEAVE